MNNDLIYLICTGNMGFNGNKHVHNFLKYLFSCSQAHQQNDITKKNFYIHLEKESQKLKTFGFVVDSKDKYNKFKNKFWNEIIDDTTLTNDLFYIGFFITLKERNISNIFEINPDNPTELILNLLPSITEYIIDDYFSGSEDNFLATMNEKINSGYYVPFSQATDEERLMIEKKIHSQLIKNSAGKNVLLAISHHDQEDSHYHIHRLIKE